ncbi:MAG TPA: hypothetical protein VJB14_11365, partial [Planctomycetota bacterium]|nr:hypothetical protein [Planctomycetota bacterium]
EPLRIGDAWMVQAPGDARLWGRIEIRGGTVTNRFSAPEGRPSERAAAARKKAGLPVDPPRGVLLPGRPGVRVPAVRTEPTPSTPAEAVLPVALETSNRACRLKIRAASERAAYGSRVASAGKRLLVLDAEFENTIPMTLVQSNQVPTMYKIKELGDHLYLVVNGTRVSRIVPDGSRLPGHVVTAGFTIDRLGARVRGNIVFEIPAEKAATLDLRFYDYAHGHMALTLREEGRRVEAKPLVPLQENEVLEGGIFRVERVREAAGRKAPEGMTFLAVEVRARSRMSTESDATAFDPKAKPGEKIQVGTVSDWTDARKHLHVLLDGRYSYGSSDLLEFGEAPRFLPDLHTGGTVLFLVPEKAESLEVRGDFPNARLPDGMIVHPKALSFLLEGKRPEPAATPPIVEIDDEVFKVAVTGQAVAAEFAGVKAPAGATFLILDVTVTGAGKAGEMFQTADQLHYATEKGAQLAMHEAAFKGPRAPAKLLLVPTGERRGFQAVFAIPGTDRKPRLAYRGVTKASMVDLKPLEAAAARACPKCKLAAGPGEKFCADCGTKIDP